MAHDIIELNGKRYDALTGEYLGKASVVPKHLGLQRRTVDGFARQPLSQEVHQREATKPADQVKAQHTNTRSAPRVNPIKHHKPERTRTLMRHSVHHTTPTLKPAIKVQAPAEVSLESHTTKVVPKAALSSVNPARSKRAVAIKRHQSIRRFSPNQPSVRAALPHAPAISIRPEPSKHSPAPDVRPGKKTSDIFEAAVLRATSHEQPAPKAHRRRRSRLTNRLSLVATFLVIGSFIGYLSMPGISLRVASFQAGFGVSMPGYTPTGYALEGGIKRAGGTVSLSFRSGENQFTITQQASNWNSQTLLDNTLALAGKHESVQKNGQTVYIYDNGTNAAWVNGGVRYDLSSNTYLDSQEIADIAVNL